MLGHGALTLVFYTAASPFLVCSKVAAVLPTRHKSLHSLSRDTGEPEPLAVDMS